MKIDLLFPGIYGTARFLPLVKALESYGIEFKVVKPISWDSILKGKLGNIMYTLLAHPLKEYVKMLKYSADLVIVGSTSTPQIYLLQKLLRRKKVKIIVDLYDAIFLPVGRLFGINVRPGSFCLEGVVRDADFVTVNGHYLLSYVRTFNKSSAIIHDPIDCNLFSPKLRSSHKKLTIGWEGTALVHHENLAMLIKPLKKLSREFDLQFKMVSYLGDLRVKQMFEKLENWMEIDYGPDHWLPLKDFAKCMANFDIMVAPLQNTPWYEGKSALRVGIGMAMGVPVVASPVGEQKYLIRHGVNGFLARNEEEWYNYLKILIENSSLRMNMGISGRMTAESELSLGVIGRRLYEIINALISK